ncbi:MAG: DMT family transporter [Methanobacteriota archaeon]
MNKSVFISFLLVLVSFVWAGSFIVVKSMTDGNMDPVSLGFLRFLVATPLMILVVILRKKPLVLPLKEFPWLLVLGLSGVTFLYVFQFVGIQYTTASTSAVLINTNVIFIAILSVLLLHERLTRKRSLGIILSFVGVLLVMLSQLSPEDFTLTNTFVLGCLFILLSAMCWAVYSLVGKRLLKVYDEWVITMYAFILGTLCFLPFVFSDLPSMVFQTSVSGWLAVLYLAVACSLFGYLGWYYALKHIDASQAAVFLNFIPLFTIIMSFVLGERITWFFLLGAIFIIYGVYLAQRS